MRANILEMEGITKAFPGVKALDRVDFVCAQGTIHALVGENGAGKSTLMKVLAGAYRPDAGTIMIRGEPVRFSSPREAQQAGISIIYQEFNLIPELDVAENVFLGREPLKRRGFIDRNELYRRAEKLLAGLGADIDLYAKAKTLSVAQQQMVEVAKALSLNADILIMDEPSAVVSGKELASLFQTIRRLRDAGKTVIYISHRIDEIFEIAELATVLKDGKVVGTVQTAVVDKPTIIRMMVGRSLDEAFPPKQCGERRPILELKNVVQRRTLKGVSLVAYSGEILGVAGLVGSGRTDLARVIFGAEPIDRGEIVFEGTPMRRLIPSEAIARGMGFVTEDRKKEGLVHCLPVKANLTLSILRRIQRCFLIREQEETRISQACVREFNIATPSIHQEVQYLSGGNQQKVILAKWINAEPKLIIMDEPTRGIDVGAKSEIYGLMRSLAERGTAIIMISSELPEILGMSDRILVMHDGLIMGELSPEEASEEVILMMATGQGVPDIKGECALEA